MRARKTMFRVGPRLVSTCLGLMATSCMQAPSALGQDDGSGASAPARRVATAPSNGFNDTIAWRRLDEGLAEAAKLHRPLMLVVHASWCSSCQALKPAFSDETLVDLSHGFVMINLDQDLEPRSLEFAPDGTYIPRVVFLDPQTGRPDTAILNQRRADRRYYYAPSDDIVAAMKKALARHGET